MKEINELRIGDIVMPINYHRNSTNQFECRVVDIDMYTRGILRPQYCHRILIEPVDPNNTLIRDHYVKDNWYSSRALRFIRHGSIKVKVKRVK